jgi:transcriptional regulator with XRE-family HTH domain
VKVVEFGKYIRSLRKKKDLTLVELSKLSGVSHPYLSQIENGKTKTVASPEILNKVAGPLGTKYEDLMEKAGYLKSFIKALKNDENEETRLIDQLSKIFSYMGDNRLEESLKSQKQLEEILANGIVLKFSIETFFEVTQNEKLYYRDIELSSEDRQRILDMLKLIFPERQ